MCAQHLVSFVYLLETFLLWKELLHNKAPFSPYTVFLYLVNSEINKFIFIHSIKSFQPFIEVVVVPLLIKQVIFFNSFIQCAVFLFSLLPKFEIMMRVLNICLFPVPVFWQFVEKQWDPNQSMDWTVILPNKLQTLNWLLLFQLELYIGF